MNYYISDIHFGDQRLFDLCKRPFSSLEEMDVYIIQKWNSKVSKEDMVYILGDLGYDQQSIELYRQLNGIKKLIVGNHDESMLDYIKGTYIFESIEYMNMVNDGNNKVFLCHYPIMDWPEDDNDSVLVYGHIHNKTEQNDNRFKEIKEYYANTKAYNCSIDVIGFEPRTLKELMTLKEANKNEAYIN